MMVNVVLLLTGAAVNAVGIRRRGAPPKTDEARGHDVGEAPPPG
jgi:hypothetical protein